MLGKMLGNFDFYGLVILGLVETPFIGFGYVLGMLHMRRNYLQLLRQERIEKSRAERYALGRERQARYMGYAVGYREGRRDWNC